jgi:ribosome-binding factor A
MGSRRQLRVAELIQAEISAILRRRIKDPRVGFVTITGVKISPDLQSARVYFSTLGGPKEADRALEGLRSAAGYIRGEVGRLLELRHSPHLSFQFDESLERGARIESQLRELGLGGVAETEPGGTEEEAGGGDGEPGDSSPPAEGQPGS